MPCLVTERKWCGWHAAPIASSAICTLPSVPFLKPTGIDSPEANSRWIWLSVVRAPIAPQQIKSAINCGLIVSRNSEPAGSPMWASCASRPRAMRKPLLMSKLPSKCGSLINPFQPTVVRGFSKYTRIIMHNSPLRAVTFSNKNRPYSSAASGSWIEQGPTTTAKRSSSSVNIASSARRVAATVCEAFSESGTSSIRIAGGIRGLSWAMRRSSVDSNKKSSSS